MESKAPADSGPVGCLTFLYGPLEVVQHAVVVDLAEHLLLHQSELLPGGQLPLAGEAGEAGQVVHVALRPADPVCGVDVPAAACAPGAESSAGEGEHIRHMGIKRSVYISFFYYYYYYYYYYYLLLKVSEFCVLFQAE